MTRNVQLVAIGVALLAGMATLSAQQARTVEGTLVDAKCYLSDNRNTGTDHGDMKGCGPMCLKMGSPAAVLAADKTVYTIAAPASDLADYVGQTVRVTGPVTSGVILAQTAEVNRSGSWQPIKLSGMMK